MTRYDRYFFRIVITNILLALVAVSFLFLAVDFLVNVGEYTTRGASPMQIAREYLFRIPPVLYMLMPLVVLLGGMFAIVRLLKNRELLPLQIAGVRVWRALAAFWAAALVCGGGMAAAQEYLLPAVEAQAMSATVSSIKGAGGEDRVLFDEAHPKRNLWHIRHYDLFAHTPWMENVNIFRLDEFGVCKERIHATRLEYRDGRWRGEYATLSMASLAAPAGPSPEHAAGILELPAGLHMAPGYLARSGTQLDATSISGRLARMTEEPDREDLALAFYQALVYPLACVSLLMLGVTIAMRLNARSVMLASAVTLVMAFAGYSLNFFADGLVIRGAVGAATAAFAPALLLLGLGLWCLRRKCD